MSTHIPPSAGLSVDDFAEGDTLWFWSGPMPSPTSAIVSHVGTDRLTVRGSTGVPVGLDTDRVLTAPCRGHWTVRYRAAEFVD